MRWLKYRETHGPMDNSRKYDRPAALQATVANNVAGGKSELSDFLPYDKPHDDSIDRLFRTH